MNDNPRPPWIAFPRIPWGSIGWRMGGGENYWHQWTPWFKALSQAARGQYRRDWPEPEGWKGFFEFVEFGHIPPWREQLTKRMEEAAKPLKPEESVVDDYYRIAWLVRNQLKEVAVVTQRADENMAWLYREHDGTEWRLSSFNQSGMQLTKLGSSGGA